MSQAPLPNRQAPDRRGLLSRLIDNFNPGITLLVLVWVVGLTARRYLLERDQLTGFAERGLTSLAFVVPLMLVGWALLALLDRHYDLGIFPSDSSDDD